MKLIQRQVWFWFAMLASCVAHAEVLELYWEDLAPQNALTSEVDHSGTDAAMQNVSAPVVQEYHGKTVKIAGFIVPLDGDETHIKEMLLVPYFGACIHVPPPPANQIIHVVFEQPIEMKSIYDPVWVEGKLTTDVWEGELATTGYSMSAYAVHAYDG